MTSFQEEIEKCDLTHRSQQVTRDLLMIRKGPPSTFYTVVIIPYWRHVVPGELGCLIKLYSEQMSYLLN